MLMGGDGGLEGVEALQRGERRSILMVALSTVGVVGEHQELYGDAVSCLFCQGKV